MKISEDFVDLNDKSEFVEKKIKKRKKVLFSDEVHDLESKKFNGECLLENQTLCSEIPDKKQKVKKKKLNLEGDQLENYSLCNEISDETQKMKKNKFNGEEDLLENDIMCIEIPDEKQKMKNKSNKEKDLFENDVFCVPGSDEIPPVQKNKKKKSKRVQVLLENGPLCNEISDEKQKIKKKKSKKNKNKITTDDNLTEKYIKLILDPIEECSFFENNWEERPVHISRKQSGFYDFFITVDEIYEIISTKNLHRFQIFTDVNDNLKNTAIFEKDFLYYTENECFAIINPEKHFTTVHQVISELQDLFSARIHTKIFICPKNKNVISPRSDTTDTFILQIDGTSDWQLYFPSEMLPMKSEIHCDRDELKPVMSAALCPGDLLYFPNGLPYECESSNDERSIFVVLSITKITWGDFLKVLLPMALQQKFESNWQFRSNLPVGYLNYCGQAHINNDSKKKVKFMIKLQDYVTELFSNMPIDSVVDQLAKYHLQQFIPPHISSSDKKKSIFQKGNSILNKGETLPVIEFNSKIRLINQKAVRLVLEENEYRVYHSLHNNFINVNMNFIVISSIIAPGIEALIRNYPRFIQVSDLPIEDDTEKIEISEVLWKNGLIITNEDI